MCLLIMLVVWWVPQCSWRQFSLRFSAVEIYNEIVRDLLDPSSGPLRLLDDPEVSLSCPWQGTPSAGMGTAATAPHI